MKIPSLNRALTTLLAALLAASLPAGAYAADDGATYRVDVIVFLNTWATSEPGTEVNHQIDPLAIDPSNTAALSAAGIHVLPDSAFGLTGEWHRLANSRQFKPLLRLAWTQANPPRDHGPALLIQSGDRLTFGDPSTMTSRIMYSVEGSLSLQVNRYLHLDTELYYTTPGHDRYVQYALQENRLMRRGELHHLDSPKLGVLARVTRVKEEP